MFAGGVLSWLVLLPLLSILGNYMPVPVPAGAGERAARSTEMQRAQLWSAYIRYTGAGAVLAAGLITLRAHHPDDRVVVPREREGLRRRSGGRRRRSAPSAIMPMTVVLGGSLAAGDLPRRRAEDADAGQLPRRRS